MNAEALAAETQVSLGGRAIRGRARTSHEMSTLSIVIPAYNEEKAIGAIVERCLAARDHIKDGTGVTDVEIIVVNDGSADGTREVASRYSDITLISHPVNRGYGVAIKTGFAAARGDLVSFLDADGTCDPRFFRDLTRALESGRADISIGSRLTPQSRMPLLRLIGNVFYALLLGALSNRSVTDTASGMRIIRRSSLSRIFPLPDGMDFTPAMSAKALFDEELVIVETPMAYHERVGASKLRVISDGIRFLRSIVECALIYRPGRLFSLLAVPFLAIAVLFSVHPVEVYLRERRLDEWMIYRLITVLMCYLVASVLLTASVLSERFVAVIRGRRRVPGFVFGLAQQFITPKALMITGAVLLAVAALMNYEAARQYLATRQIAVHWSRVLVGGFLVSAAIHLAVTAVMVRMADILFEKQAEQR
jgi:glycosyltransferase involved in cell wall biosynthesis